jgi:hypothetical protein
LLDCKKRFCLGGVLSTSITKICSLLAGCFCLAIASTSVAATNPTTCLNDIDCVATPQCGGDVCTYGVNGMTCTPAGTGTKGLDGWCGQDSDCKCAGLGAKCDGVFCTFTKPADAPAGGSTGQGGGGATGSGGTTGTGGATAGDAAVAKTTSGGGGCDIASSSLFATAFAPGVALLLVAFAVRRRRRPNA